MAQKATEYLCSTREGWRLYQGDTKAAKRRRNYADEDFARMFPGGHEYSLRDMTLAAHDDDFLHAMDTRRPGHSLRDIHPKALQLLVAYGMDYTPYQCGKEAYDEKIQPVMGACFRNSYFLMQDRNRARDAEHEFLYVEGIAYGVMVQPMLHAWNSTKRSPHLAVDWTLYPSTQWIRYYGIPLSAAEHQHVHAVSGANEKRVSVLHRERFESIEKGLREVLSSRSTNPGPTP